MTPDETFSALAWPWIVKAEGGFVDHPGDPGGPTNLGISLRAVRLRDVDGDGRKDFDLDHDGDVDAEDIRRIDTAEGMDAARREYLEGYWKLPSSRTPRHTCGDFPPAISVVLFDASVLQGPRTAVALLQQATRRLDADGIVGPRTIEIVSAFRSADLVPRFLALRIKRYSQLSHAATFIEGWAWRMFRLMAELPH